MSNYDLSLPKLLRESLLNEFPIIKNMAIATKCKRKGVGCVIYEIDISNGDINRTYAINGPSGEDNVCQNIVGACGCGHSEPRAIMDYMRTRGSYKLSNTNLKTFLLTTYSACVNCANIMVDSKIIDVNIYEIEAPYWNEHPRNADKIIKNSSIKLWTMNLIREDLKCINIRGLLDT